MREKKREIGGRNVPGAIWKHLRYAVKHRRASGRTIARNGDQAAMPRRSEIDRPGGLGKPRECHAMMETTSTTFAATPARADTLPTFVERRARPGGGRTLPSSGRDVAPAPCDLRRHDRGAVPCNRHSPVDAVPCFHAKGRPVCPCQSTAAAPGLLVDSHTASRSESADNLRPPTAEYKSSSSTTFHDSRALRCELPTIRRDTADREAAAAATTSEETVRSFDQAHPRMGRQLSRTDRDLAEEALREDPRNCGRYLECDTPGVASKRKGIDNAHHAGAVSQKAPRRAKSPRPSTPFGEARPSMG